IAWIAGANSITSGVSYFIVSAPFLERGKELNSRLPERPLQRTPQQSAYLVLPVNVRLMRVVVGRRLGILEDRDNGLHDAGSLNRIDRRGQCSQFWSFVFHGFHLLFCEIESGKSTLGCGSVRYNGRSRSQLT